ncbi:nematoblast specific protein [Polaribacter sp. ALD11]|uniref:DUF3472 domain-containing protein n=1 Tax=Polaribacter sp. ALD11 TaxID=2058137 RepID=UPI000C30D2ED|nr:DUF3472 domain-containing protein [Polaribacter sp. ALD11]AUC83846.1 nematoblast specific protein [Polaribacter sp. ALD11]
MILNKTKKTLSGISIIILSVFMMGIVFSCKNDKNPDQIAATKIKPLSFEIPAKGNSWVTNNVVLNNRIIRDDGIRNWKDSETRIKTYFKTEKTGKINLMLKLKGIEESSKIRISLGSDTKEITIKKANKKEVSIGEFNISKAGYQTIEIQGLQKDGTVYADIDAFIIEGAATAANVYFIKEDFYFGRRGPSVHLSYELPKEKKITYFYNEINVPEGEDVIGSYYMANGFKDGYFGIQVNSETERRILFSVWSPFDTQDPNEIPDDHKIILLGKGDGVTSGEFGNEGSGGQSYKVYNWKASTTYKFLLKGVPAKNNSTDYTAYFYAPEQGKWNLIASFRRPQASRYLQNLYSFLENFETKTGYISRKANYNNQWIYTSDNEWIELTKAKFTADATARKESRWDYAGGVEGNKFFMKNCGFFSDTTPIDSHFTRKSNGVAPIIDFSKLEALE